MGCAWFIYRKMELRYWLVLGNVKNNRINKSNEKHSRGLRVQRREFLSSVCGFPCFLDVGRGRRLSYVA